MSAKALLTTPKKLRSKLFSSTTGKKKEHQLMTPQLYASVGSMSMGDSFGGDGGTASNNKKNSHFKELDSLLEKSPKQHIRHTSNPESYSNSNSNISLLYQEDAVVNTETIVFEEKSSKDEHVEKKKVEQASLAKIPQQQSTTLPHDESIKQMILLVPPSPTKSRKKTRRKVRSLSPSKLSKTTGGQRAGSPLKKKVTKESKKDKDAENNKQLFPAQHEASIRSERTAVVSNTSAAASSIISPRTTPKSHHRSSKTKTNHKGEDKASPTTPRINEGGRTDEKVTSPSTPSKKRSSTRRTRSLSAKKHPPRTKKESATRTRRKSHLGTVEYSAKKQEGTKREEQQPYSPSDKKSSKNDEDAENYEGFNKVMVLVQKLEAAIESSTTSAKDKKTKTSPPPRKRRSRSLRVAPVRRSLPTPPPKAADDSGIVVEKDKNEKKKAAMTTPIEPMPSGIMLHKTSPRRRIKRSSSADLILEKAMASFGLVRQKKQPSPSSPQAPHLSGKKKKTTKGKKNSSPALPSPRKKAHKKNKDDPLLLSDDETKAESCTSGRDDDDSFPTAEDDSNVAILHTSQECFLQFTIPTLD